MQCFDALKGALLKKKLINAKQNWQNQISTFPAKLNIKNWFWFQRFTLKIGMQLCQYIFLECTKEAKTGVLKRTLEGDLKNTRWNGTSLMHYVTIRGAFDQPSIFKPPLVIDCAMYWGFHLLSCLQMALKPILCLKLTKNYPEFWWNSWFKTSECLKSRFKMEKESLLGDGNKTNSAVSFWKIYQVSVFLIDI